jgi:predicted unusual protein kinase regulating ubiquinone biosynthesis (AarF/ABC1/UbiB family)
MFGTVLVSLAVLLVLGTFALPTTRRIYVFIWHLTKYVNLWLYRDVVGIGRASAALRRTPFVPLSRPRLLRRFFEDLGPTFIKFGQIIASSSGMFPKRYVDEFQRCLDRVRPFPFSEVDEILRAELGSQAARLSAIDPVPLASASIAQVHTATLDNGIQVVVKVQRPGIESRMAADMKIMRSMALVVEKLVRDAELASPVAILEDFAATLKQEIDFRIEADNLERFNQIMAELAYKDVRAPRPYLELTTRRVLVMERFHGTRVDHADAIRARGINAEEKLIKGLRSWFQCVILYGFFHGDVHAGNLMLLDNEDLGFLDFGIVGRFDPRQKAMVTDWIVAFAGGDYRALADVIADMGGVSSQIDRDAFSRDLEIAYGPLLKKSFGDINYADILPQVHRVATKHRMRMPKEFVLITKQMLYFDRYAKLLAPSLQLFTDPRLVMSLAEDVARARAATPAAAAR